ncbi:MAG: efflux RND transporter periplasmic adaptor subunit [Dysgonamonadaceae bacterium]|nr:efflux RND transporter periplasmic adaptor subunit [Dysgonamonadaceae bacterium]MDD4729440.1 efflux RND transporter periplasmic adaptor subunit [Dysgonamonadaceae bacterium]
MKTNTKTIILVLSTLIIGLLLGWLIFGGASSNDNGADLTEHSHVGEETIWTCSMHPQIRQNEPGACPICGMDLIPLEDDQNDDIDPMAISMSATAMQLADVQTAVVGAMDHTKQVRLNGKVQEDERLVFSQSSHVPGRIENLKVNFTGDYVTKGQVIASVYSPELVTAQEELYEAQKVMDTQPQLFNAAKEKLKTWKLTDGQIEQMLQSGITTETFDIQADVSGYVIQKLVNPGDYVQRGQPIYEIADLSRVWVLFDVYESDMGWINKGAKVEYTVSSLPGETFTGTISFVDPMINPITRVAKARVVTTNRGLKLKPEMFVSGIVQAELKKTTDAVVVPKSAVMWTGPRSVVYVKSVSDQGVSFQLREVTLGPALGESFVIGEGLEIGEEIAVNGTFSIDAAAQLSGRPSMMSPDGGPSMSGHDHGDIPSFEEISDVERLSDINPAFKAQLTNVYNAYLKMNDAFVESNAQDVAKEAKDVIEAFKSVDMSLLKGDAHIIWMEQLETLNSKIDAISKSKVIEKQRQEYVQFNLVFYKSVKMFGLDGVTVYYQYCPMANNDKGAYWLSNIEEIRNPYFGDAMMSCGETKETIK